MWFGLLHLSLDEGDDVQHDTVIVIAYEPHRLFKVGGPVTMAPGLLAMLREASDQGRRLEPPRCGTCAAPLEVPPMEEEEAECASA
jgi:hypothetical protein